MSEKELKVRIQHKHDSEANWAKATNFIPKQAELVIYDSDATYTYPRIKVGDGVKTINELSFIDEIKANKNEVSEQINAHNIATNSHSDIRLLIEGLTTRLNTLANSDDETLDQMSEIVAYIKSNKSLIDSITANKVNVNDIINNLTTNVSNKPLSAAQGVTLKALIDAIVVPTKVSQLTNDKGYLTEHQDISGKLDANKLPEAVNNALAQAKASGEFDGNDGQRGTGILNTTTGIASYNSTVGGVSVKYRILLSTLKTQASVSDVLVGDTVRYSTFLYPIIYVDAEYAYMTTRVTIQGSAGTAGKDGTSVTVTSVTESSTDGGSNVVTFSDGKTLTVKNGNKGADGKNGTDATVTAQNIQAALGYTPMNPGEYAVSVKAVGAKGDGSTDDTAVFQTALANNRRVYVPGGTYKLSGELVIRDNCQLELAQDVVLNFAQTSGNCITLNRSSWLKGNHATIFVPYAFTGKVINADTTVHTNAKDVTPWVHWDPQWKTARYITDINICKFDGNGIHQSKTGDTNGTAVYISATGGGASTFMWGVNLSGLRIAGAFEYGIRAQNFNSGWNHEMRLEAFIDACKIGLSLEDCNKVYFAGSIQPRKAANGTVYAKHGIQLIRSKDTELSGSRVWDWNDANSLWTFDKSNVNQHIAMYGNCCGTILNDYLYHNLPSGFSDIRELIYTDTSANFDSLIIVQEPFTKWFKPVDGHPNFNNGVDGNQRLLLKSEQDALFQTDVIPNFTNLLPMATDESGAVFNGMGYKPGAYWNGTWRDSALYTENYNNYAATGYMRCSKGSVIHLEGIKFSDKENYEGIAVFDSSYNKLTHVSTKNLRAGSYYCGYAETETGCIITVKSISEFSNAFWFKLNLYPAGMSSNPVITVDEEISYSQKGFLADGINVKGEFVTGLDTKFLRQNQRVLAISEASTDEQYPTAKAVYALVSGTMGAYVDAVDALIGGGG